MRINVNNQSNWTSATLGANTCSQFLETWGSFPGENIESFIDGHLGYQTYYEDACRKWYTQGVKELAKSYKVANSFPWSF